MGEFAYTLDGSDRIKIGTSEDLLYLRADQLGLLNFASRAQILKGKNEYRFRFPWPTEDNVRPGDFEDGDYSVPIPLDDLSILDKIDHQEVQFIAGQRRGFNVMLPCPLSKAGLDSGLNFHKNGFGGPVRLVQQRAWRGHLVAVMDCGGCGSRFRIPSLAEAELFVVALRSRADRHHHRGDDLTAKYWHTIADRMVAGYLNPPSWVLAG